MGRPRFPRPFTPGERQHNDQSQKCFFPSNTSEPYAFLKWWCTTYKEPRFGYDPIPYQPNMKIEGYFQSYKYFDHHRDEICRLFAPSTDVIDHLSKEYEFILEHPLTVSLHIRSYFDHDPEQKVYLACTKDRLKRRSANSRLKPSSSYFQMTSHGAANFLRG